MLAAIASSNWQGIVPIALLLAFYISARKWWMESSVQRLVLVRVHFEDGTNEDIVSFPWRLKELLRVLEEKPLKHDLAEYLHFRSKWWYVRTQRNIDRVDLYKFRTDWSWSYDASLHDQFQFKKTLWTAGVRYWTGK